MLSFPGLHLETVVMIPFTDTFDQVQDQEKQEAMSPELLHMLQLVKNPTAVGKELFDPGVVQTDGTPQGQRH